MQKTYWIWVHILAISIILSSCSKPDSALPSSVELTTDSRTPLTEVTFLLAVPPEVTSTSKISLVSLDTITGFDIQIIQTAMTKRPDGRFETTLTVPVGSVITYRYIRTAPAEAVEVTAQGNPVSYRIAYIPGPTQIEETLAGFVDLPFAGQTGRIMGRIVTHETGTGQPGLLVSAGGQVVFTEADGFFRLDGLPVGIHRLTVINPDGATLPNAQGALVASGTTTPVELQVRQATPVFVTFQLTVPEGLSPDAIVRLTGNVSTLGNRFVNLSGGTRVSVAHMPTLVRVDAQHFLAVLSLYAGMDLRYRYTLGDGLWNAEVDGEGSLLTRQIILPDQDVILRDNLIAWGNPGNPPIRFMLKVPEDTPGNDQISIQFKPTGWFEAVPMWRLSADSWYYDLYGPLQKDVEFQYRYCRNGQCGAADDADTAGPEASGRTLTYRGEAQIIDDQVHAWRWLEETPLTQAVLAEPVAARPGAVTGVEFSAFYQPSWRPMLAGSLQHLRALGADSLIFPLNWTWTQQNPFPILDQDPARSPLYADLQSLTQQSREAGLELMLRVHPSTSGAAARAWWESARRDPIWWQLWFEEYRLAALSTAELASQLGIDVLILGGEWARPALPDSLLFSGEPSGAPADAEARWRALIADVRSTFPGRVIFELDLASEIPDMPAFLDSVDAILLHWQIPAPGDDVSLMVQGFIPFLDLLDTRTQTFNRPLWISIEYASVQGGAAVCPPAPDGSCRSIALFARGQDVDPDLQPSFEEQTDAINAVFLATHNRPSVQGFFVRGFDPSAILWDKSSSIYGKPAEDVLRYWYPHLNAD